MDLQVKNSSDTVSISDRLLGAEFNEALVHQVVVAYMAKARAGTKAQKTRAEVSGGGRKPWRQKGTGRARSGTIRSPIWRTGGVTFAAKPRDYAQKVNRKMWRGAMRSILSELARQERLVVVDALTLDQPRTKVFVARMNELGVTRGLVVTEDVDPNLYLGSRNVHGFEVTDTAALNPVSLVGSESVVITVDALKRLEGMLQ